MIRFFKRRRPVIGAGLSIQDLMVLRWHGHTLAEWDAFPAVVKVDKREAYYAAQGLAS